MCSARRFSRVVRGLLRAFLYLYLILVTTLGVVISDGKDSEDSSNTTRGTVDDEEGDMRRRGARECDEALMEATEARRGYARVAAWDEGNLIQAMARLKNPTIAWRYGDG